MAQGAFSKQVHRRREQRARQTRRTGMAAAVAARRGAVGAAAGVEVVVVTGAEVAAGTSAVPDRDPGNEEGGIHVVLAVGEGHPCLLGLLEAGAVAETGGGGVQCLPGEEAWMTSHLRRETCAQSFACSFHSAFVRGIWRSSFLP